MIEGVEAPGPPGKHAEPAASVETGADASAGRPGYVSDEAHEPVSGPSHGERKKGEHARAPAPPERTHVQAKAPGRKRALLPGVSDRLHTGPPAQPVSHGVRRQARASSGFQNRDIRSVPLCQRKVPPGFCSRARRKPTHKASVSFAGVPWTEGGHRLFLLGLQKLGKVGCWLEAVSSVVVAKYPPPKRSRAGCLHVDLIGLTFYEWGAQGDWRGISRHYVTTRTPTQVASHAQKHFIRQSSLTKRKRRSSLFDITGDGAENSVRGGSTSAAPAPTY